MIPQTTTPGFPVFIAILVLCISFVSSSTIAHTEQLSTPTTLSRLTQSQFWIETEGCRFSSFRIPDNRWASALSNLVVDVESTNGGCALNYRFLSPALHRLREKYEMHIVYNLSEKPKMSELFDRPNFTFQVEAIGTLPLTGVTICSTDWRTVLPNDTYHRYKFEKEPSRVGSRNLRYLQYHNNVTPGISDFSSDDYLRQPLSIPSRESFQITMTSETSSANSFRHPLRRVWSKVELTMTDFSSDTPGADTQELYLTHRFFKHGQEPTGRFQPQCASR